MAEPWQCPACKTWLAPHVSEHRCDPEDGVGAVPVAPAPCSPTSGTLTWTPQPGWTVTTTNVPVTTWARSNVTMIFGDEPMVDGELPKVA